MPLSTVVGPAMCCIPGGIFLASSRSQASSPSQPLHFCLEGPVSPQSEGPQSEGPQSYPHSSFQAVLSLQPHGLDQIGTSSQGSCSQSYTLLSPF